MTPTTTSSAQERTAGTTDRVPRVDRVTQRTDAAERAEGKLRMRDRFQTLFWRQLIAAAVRIQSVRQPHRAPAEFDYVRPIPAGRRYPGLLDSPLYFAEETPPSERHPLLEAFVIRFTWWMKEWYAMGNRLHQPYLGIGAPYFPEFAALQPAPRIPVDFQASDRLAGIARRGPFSLQTRSASRNEFEIDLRLLEGLDPRAPFIATGGLARFRRTPKQTLETIGIEFRGKLVRPGDADWALTEKRFLTGLSSYTTFIEHLVRVHIITAGVWAICTRLAFSTRHPLRILMQPFIEETSRVNNYNIDGLILTHNSNVPLYSGYTLEQSDGLIRQAAASFDIRLMDPEQRATTQGQLGDAMFPTVESAVALFRVFRSFTGAWCRAFLPQVDLETRIFVEELDRRVPNGIRSLIGITQWDELNPDHVAHILAVGAFTASVSHHIANDLTRDYMMSFHIMAPAIDAQGLSTLGLVLEKQESIVIAGIQRFMLVADAFMPDERSRRLWSQFQDDLKSFEGRQGEAPDEIRPYLLQPSHMASSVHA